MKTYKQSDDASRKRVEEGDRIVVSGYECWENRFFYNLKGMVGSAEPAQFKLWPDLELANGNGKLWFDRRFTRVRIIRKWWT